MLTRTTSVHAPFAAMSREMDRLFESMVGSTPRVPRSDPRELRVVAPLNVWEDDANAYVETEVPGVRMDDIEIVVEGDELTIRGRRECAPPDGATVLRRERGSGAFERRAALPGEIDVDRVEAGLRDGVLIVTLPKVPERRPRRIEVRALPAGA